MMNSNTLRVSESNHILSVELNRPEVRNAFNPEMIQALTDTFRRASEGKNLAGVLLYGAGAAFCAGADLSWMQQMVKYSHAENLEDSKKLYAMFSTIWDCEVPVIGYGHGSVFGGGIGMLACCDLVVAAPDTKFCFSEVKLGLSPAVISSFISKRGILAPLHSSMIFGNIFSCDEALVSGLVQKSEIWEDPKSKASDLIAKNGADAMRTTKALLRQLPSLNAESARAQSTDLISKLRVSPDAQSRLKAFLSRTNKIETDHVDAKKSGETEKNTAIKGAKR